MAAYSETELKNVTENIMRAENSGAMTGKVRLRIFDGEGNEHSVHSMFESCDIAELQNNKTLNTAKIILSKMMAGDQDYRLAKIGFGNAGHDFLNKKVKRVVTAEDTEVRVISLIRDSLQGGDDEHYIYKDSNDVEHRLSYIEKDITPQNITFGENGNQFIVRVPISFADYNSRVGDADTDNTVLYKDEIAAFDTVDGDGSLMMHRNLDSDGNIIDGGTVSEVIRIDDDGTYRYKFFNGLVDGAIDKDNHGERPQEVSEIMLCTNIVGDGSSASPYRKLASSITTSGLLELPEDFSFLFEWSLTWSFAE